MRTVPALLIGALVLAGCGSGATSSEVGAPGEFPMTVRDCGREVTIEEPPQRVVTLGADLSTAVVAAGAADRIIARANEGGSPLGPYRGELESVPQVSPQDDLSREVIIGQEPDLVVSYGLNLTTAEDLAAVDIPSVVPFWRCDGNGSGPSQGDVQFEDIFGQIEEFGRLLGTAEVASANVADLRRRVAAVAGQERSAPVQRAAVIYLAQGNLSAYGRPAISHAQLATLGLTDVFADLPERVTEISIEELINRDPDVIVAVGACESDAEILRRLRDLPGVDRLPAVEAGRVVPLDFTYVVGGPLAVDGVEIVAGAVAGFG